jgi:iron complex transport system ATP-binding protein
METMRALMRAGKTLLLVTHHIHEIPPEIERVVLLNGGRVAADGPRHRC